MKHFIRLRPISYFFRRDWYGKRGKDGYEKYLYIWDIGAITIGKRRSSYEQRGANKVSQ